MATFACLNKLVDVAATFGAASGVQTAVPRETNAQFSHQALPHGGPSDFALLPLMAHYGRKGELTGPMITSRYLLVMWPKQRADHLCPHCAASQQSHLPGSARQAGLPLPVMPVAGMSGHGPVVQFP